MDDKIITRAKYDSYIEAEMVRQTLEDEGIKAITTGVNAANMYSVPSVAEVQLQVLESQAEEAMQILEDMSAAAESDEDEDDGEDIDDE